MKQFRIAALPWYRVDDCIHVALMVPSNPAYGGTKPQLAKGLRDKEDEDDLAAALREGNEELGLLSGCVLRKGMRVCGPVRGDLAYFEMRTHIMEVTGPDAFGPFGYETGEVVLLPAAKALEQIRPNQRAVLVHALAAIQEFG